MPPRAELQIREPWATEGEQERGVTLRLSARGRTLAPKISPILPGSPVGHRLECRSLRETVLHRPFPHDTALSPAQQRPVPRVHQPLARPDSHTRAKRDYPALR